MTANKLLNSYLLFNVNFGIYGFIRGVNCVECENNQLFTQSLLNKLGMGLYNSIFYAMPIFNIYPLSKLSNRLEIHFRELDPNIYKSAYEEFVGINMNTVY